MYNKVPGFESWHMDIWIQQNFQVLIEATDTKESMKAVLPVWDHLRCDLYIELLTQFPIQYEPHSRSLGLYICTITWCEDFALTTAQMLNGSIVRLLPTFATLFPIKNLWCPVLMQVWSPRVGTSIKYLINSNVTSMVELPRRRRPGPVEQSILMLGNILAINFSKLTTRNPFLLLF